MHLNPAEPRALQLMGLDKTKGFLVRGTGHGGQPGQQGQDALSRPHPAAGQFSDHEGVNGHLPALEPGGERRVAAAEVVHPD